MKKISLLKIILIFSLIGILFSGYLTITKLISGTCAINDGCALLWGYPTCLYGFIIYLALFVFAVLSLVKKNLSGRAMKTVFYVSILGILFSGYFSYRDIAYPVCKIGECPLFLPACIWGLIMYIVIFISAYLILYKK